MIDIHDSPRGGANVPRQMLASVSICRWQHKALGLHEVTFLCHGPAWAGKDPPLFSRWDATLVIRSGQWKPRVNCSFMGLSCLAEPLPDTRISGCWPGTVSMSSCFRVHPEVPQGPISDAWPYLKQRQSLVILACSSLTSNDWFVPDTNNKQVSSGASFHSRPNLSPSGTLFILFLVTSHHLASAQHPLPEDRGQQLLWLLAEPERQLCLACSRSD